LDRQEVHKMHATAPIETPRRTLRDSVLPFLTSLCVHATVVLIGVLMFRTLVTPKQIVFENQAVTPDGMVMDDALSGPVSAAQPPLVKPVVDESPDNVEARSQAFPHADRLNLEESSSDASLILGGPRLSVEPEGKGPKRSRIPFGEPNSDGIGRGPGSIFGPGGVRASGTGRIQSVAYVCDASGSMIDKFAALREQLRRSVGSLKPIQSFNVIFFRDERAAALSSNELLLAVPVNQRKFDRFLEDVNPSGQTDPIPALEIAFRQKPDLIWLLTDGDFPDNQAVLEFIRRRNKGGHVRINTIAFVDRGGVYEQVLNTVAAENGGVFKYIGEEQLGN
jgi:hypothetical protein